MTYVCDVFTVMLFTRGLCHSLAFAIQRLRGGTLVITVEGGNPTHMGVQIEDGIIDIEGLHSIEDFILRWGSIIETTPEDFNDQWADMFEYPLDPDRIMSTAKEVIRYHNV